MKLRGLYRVRWQHYGEPELQCRSCFEFLPFSEYTPRRLSMCKVCRKAENRPRQRVAMRVLRRRRRGDAAVKQAYDADYYRRNYSTLARATVR